MLPPQVLARAADHMAARRGLGGTLIRAACCRAHADGPALVLTPPSPSSDGAAAPRFGDPAAAGASSGNSVGTAASRDQAAQQHRQRQHAGWPHAATGALPRPGAAVRQTPAPTPQHSPQKAGTPIAGSELPGRGLGTPPQRPAAAAVSIPLAQPCSNARRHDDDCSATAASLQPAGSSCATPGSSEPAIGEAADPTMPADDAVQHHSSAAGDSASEQSEQQHSEAGRAAGWAAAAAAAEAHDPSGHYGSEDSALSVVREHAAALSAAAAERSDSSCSIM